MDDQLCPKCLASRVEGDSCPYCGVIYDRYRPPGGRPPPQRRGSGLGGLVALGLVLLAVLAGGGAWWFLGRTDTSAQAPGLEPPAASDAVASAEEASPPQDATATELMDRLDPHGLLGGAPPAAPGEPSPEAAGELSSDMEPDQLMHQSPRGRFSVQLPPEHGRVQRHTKTLTKPQEPMEWTGYRARVRATDAPVAQYSLQHYDVAPYVLDPQVEEEWLLGLAQGSLRQLGEPEMDVGTFPIDGQVWLRIDYTVRMGGVPQSGRLLAARVTPRDLLMLEAIGPQVGAGSSPEALGFFRSFRLDSGDASAGGPSCRQSSPDRSLRVVGVGELGRRVRGSRGCAVLVEYYAGWCPACRSAAPLVSEIAERWRPHGLAVHAFADADGTAQLERLLADERPSYDHLQLEPYGEGELSAAIEQLGASYPGRIPYFALFDTDGALVHQGTGLGTLDEMEDRLPGLLR